MTCDRGNDHGANERAGGTGRAAAIAAACFGAGLAAAMAWKVVRNRHTTSFQRRVVLITGGSRGLGLVLARRLAAEGARLVLVARTASDLDRAAAELRAGGAEVITISGDVSDPACATRAVGAAIEHFGRLDVLINNAGIIKVGPFEHMTERDVVESLQVHVMGPLHFALEAVPWMRNQGGGRIVNIASIGGLVAIPHMLPYCAGKFGLVGLSQALHHELRRHRIFVTTVNPGLMRTGSARNAMFKGQHGAEHGWFALGASLPLVSINADRAAAKIIEACRRGDASLTITPQAKAAAAANQLFPGATGAVLATVARLLPEPTEDGSPKARPGRESPSRLASSPLTKLGTRAAVRNNE